MRMMVIVMVMVMVVVVELGYIYEIINKTRTRTPGATGRTVVTRSGCGEAEEIENGRNRQAWSTADWIRPEGQTIDRDKHTAG